MPLEKPVDAWCQTHPLIADLVALRPTCWFNPQLAASAQALGDVPLGAQDVREASERLQRFAPFIQSAFPETSASKGIIESPLLALPALQGVLRAEHQL
ncbi:MAG: D-serine ammonia-lyase, partial [Pseudomonas sp.]